MERFFLDLWNQYIQLTPQAESIHRLLKEKGDLEVKNDHVAFRTVNLPGVDIEAFQKIFESLGYQVKGHYDFVKKKLNAIHLEKPNEPKIFLSELRLENFSETFQKHLKTSFSGINLTEQTLSSGRLWEISKKNYNSLLRESEYGAWLYVFGFCANHFTVNVNALKNFNLMNLCEYLEESGFILNDSGGKIKGSKEFGLMQASTRASKVEVKFKEENTEVPGCYYEFAERFERNGKLYTGFITGSADKIFESTDTKFG